eukprot:Rmarinus@m.26186
MGQEFEDFEWKYDDEPHKTRRKEILGKYPEIAKLSGYDPRSKYIVMAMFASQMLALYALEDSTWTVRLLVAYIFGGTVNHALSLALHELSHNLFFSKRWMNEYFAIFANLPLGIPSAMTFKRYHMDHHRFQGEDGVDVDVPSNAELRFFNTTVRKFFFVILQPFFYALRPIFVRPKNTSPRELQNWVAQFAFDYLVYLRFGGPGVAYLIASTLLGMGLHPVAGHFIAEHYVFVKGQETYSYYGPLNFLTWNVGYHNEHHDFPRVPGMRLPEIRRIAPEFYDTLPYHTSWVKVIWDYITDPTVGAHSRIKRRTLKSPETGEERDM